jgi:hypothetical protein
MNNDPSSVFFTSMTGADRPRWLVRTERELCKANARLVRNRQNLGAQMTVEALTLRKAMLTKNYYSPSVNGEAAHFNARESEALRFWEAERYWSNR